jgi:hypothetical protein
VTQLPEGLSCDALRRDYPDVGTAENPSAEYCVGGTVFKWVDEKNTDPQLRERFHVATGTARETRSFPAGTQLIQALKVLNPNTELRYAHNGVEFEPVAEIAGRSIVSANDGHNFEEAWDILCFALEWEPGKQYEYAPWPGGGGGRAMV